MLLAVLVPTGCVLWFMNLAMNNQRAVARQKLADAYRGQLALVRDRLESWWEKRAAELEQQAKTGVPPAIFERSVRAGLADAVICVHADGSAAYPSPGHPVPALDADDARRLQAEIRKLVQSGKKEEAVRAIERGFAGDHMARATDEAGRLIAADEQLLMLALLPRHDRRWAGFAARLRAKLMDYDNSALPSAQRLFLMEEMRAFGFEFPTYAAEKLAARFLETDGARSNDAGLRASGVPQVWKITAGPVIALFRVETVLSAMRHSLEAQPSARDVTFAVAPPGANAVHYDEWIPAGAHLPGWQITLSVRNGSASDEMARRQTASHLWVGFLVIATMAVLAVAAGEAFRRQMRLARLKTDLVAAVSHELKTPVSSIRLLVDALLDDPVFDPPKTREYLELIAKENIRLCRVIDNFLTFARMERNRHKFEFSETTPADVVRAAVDVAGDRFQTSHCRLDVEVSADLEPLCADQDALVTVLLNLLENAYKFTPEEKRISLRAFAADGRVWFAVSDNGIGIAPREQKKVFRKFYQVDRRLARRAGDAASD